MTEKRRREKTKSTLTSAQEVSYARDFKLADQAGGYTAKKQSIRKHCYLYFSIRPAILSNESYDSHYGLGGIDNGPISRTKNTR